MFFSVWLHNSFHHNLLIVGAILIFLDNLPAQRGGRPTRLGLEREESEVKGKPSSPHKVAWLGPALSPKPSRGPKAAGPPACLLPHGLPLDPCLSSRGSAPHNCRYVRSCGTSLLLSSPPVFPVEEMMFEHQLIGKVHCAVTTATMCVLAPNK